MKTTLIAIFGICLGTTAIISMAYANADVKGYTDVHGCWGECYEEHVKKFGTFSEQLEAKRVAMQQETPADRGGKLYVNCNMCHGMKGEGGIGPKLSGSTSIVAMLEAYKAGETRGAQSALMWGQAANLSTQDMEDIQAYISSLDI
tara:strand:+ start:366 stop:803 length:438 start_codon:yes stop_codon:yes gene_type:complete